MQVIDPDRFEWVVAESEGILNEAEKRLVEQRDRARRRAEILQRQIDEERSHELARLEVEHVSFKGLWRRLTSTKLGKVVTWTVVTVGGGIVTAYAVPGIVKIVVELWTWIRSRI